MKNKIFKQNLKGKSPRPGGPFLIQMLFKEPVPMPGKEKMTAVLEQRIGSVECFCHDEKTAGFAALGKMPQSGIIPWTSCLPANRLSPLAVDFRQGL